MTEKTHVMVVDDEPAIAELIRYNLEKEGFVVSVVTTGDAVLPLMIKKKPALLILDWMLPGISGIDLCRAIKKDDELKATPVIMLTAKSAETDVVQGFEQGADDFVIKPFSVKVLMARVQAALKNKGPQPLSGSRASSSEVIKIHGLQIDAGRRLVTLKNQPAELTHTEFEILYLLAKNPGWVYSRYQMVDAIRGENHAVTERSVDVQIVGLRKKLGEWGKLIQTVRGVGYRMKA